MRILLVDDEAPVLQGMTRQIESEVDDWQIESALSAAEALDLLEQEDFNVVVSEMQMPDMDGPQLLETLEKQFPNVVRVVLSGLSDRESAFRAIRPMHQYLSKPCEPQQFIDVISKAEVLQQTISSTEVLNEIGQANCLPPLPSIVEKINSELESENCTSHSLSEIISEDPLLCSKTLLLANSAVFGLRHPVVDVEQGLSIVGTEMVRALALALSVYPTSQHSTTTSTSNMFDHCFQVACISRQIAAHAKAAPNTARTAFSGALLHDVGKVILLKAFQDRYGEFLKKKRKTAQMIHDAELNEFGATHAGVGAYLLETWGLPANLIQTVAAHHSPQTCSHSSLASQIVFAANWIANGGHEEELESYEFEGQAGFIYKLQSWHKHRAELMEED